VIKLEFQLKRLSSRSRLHSHLHRIYSKRAPLMPVTAPSATAVPGGTGTGEATAVPNAGGVPGFPPFPFAPGMVAPATDPGMAASGMGAAPAADAPAADG
jgi:hypothetical protein